MKKLLLGLAVILGVFVGANVSYAASAQATWRWNFSTSCQGLLGTQYGSKDLCFETTTASIYVCSPSTGVNGACTLASDWKLAGGVWIDNGNDVYLKTARNVVVGSNYLKGSSTAGLGIDSNADGTVDVIIFPNGLVSSAAGFEYTGNDAFGNVNRTTDQSSPSVGNFWFNTSTLGFNYYNGTALKRIPTTLTWSQSFASPTSSTNRLILRPPYGIRIESVSCIVDPADTGESVPVNVQQCDSNGDNCTTIDAAITCGNTTTTDDGSISSPNITSGNWVNLNFGTVTGTVSNVTVTIKYTVNVP